MAGEEDRAETTTPARRPAADILSAVSPGPLAKSPTLLTGGRNSASVVSWVPQRWRLCPVLAWWTGYLGLLMALMIFHHHHPPLAIIPVILVTVSAVVSAAAHLARPNRICTDSEGLAVTLPRGRSAAVRWRDIEFVSRRCVLSAFGHYLWLGSNVEIGCSDPPYRLRLSLASYSLAARRELFSLMIDRFVLTECYDYQQLFRRQGAHQGRCSECAEPITRRITA